MRWNFVDEADDLADYYDAFADVADNSDDGEFNFDPKESSPTSSFSAGVLKQKPMKSSRCLFNSLVKSGFIILTPFLSALIHIQ